MNRRAFIATIPFLAEIYSCDSKPKTIKVNPSIFRDINSAITFNGVNSIPYALENGDSIYITENPSIGIRIGKTYSDLDSLRIVPAKKGGSLSSPLSHDGKLIYNIQEVILSDSTKR